MGPYRVRRLVLAGTLGPALLVSDADGTGTWVAKLITTAPEEDREPLAEAIRQRVAAQPAHPGLVPVRDVGVEPGGVYVISDWVDAPALETRLRGGRQPLEQVLEWLAPIAAGLHAAHLQGCLHGAIHPRDILLPRGAGTLTGLDISPALEALGLQAPVRVPFTAPERASGRTWTASADEYSLAMLALDALSGRRLIAGTIPAFDRWTLADTPGEDARLHEVFARALHPDPEARFGSVAEWLGALTAAAEPGTDLSRFTREGVIPPSQPPPRRRAADEVTDSALPLALFPAEDDDAEPTRAATPSGTTGADTAAAPAQPPGAGLVQSPTGEWLVASMPDDVPPLADTGPLPIQSVHVDEPADASPGRSAPPADVPVAPAVVPAVTSPTTSPATSPGAVPAAPVQSDSGDFTLRTVDAPDRDDLVDGFSQAEADPRDSWDADAGGRDETRWASVGHDDGAGPSSRTWLVVAAAVVLLGLVAFGTWRSLISDAPPAAPVTGSEEAAGAVDGSGDDAAASGPEVISDTALRPSAADTAPGAPPPPEAAASAAGPVPASKGASAPTSAAATPSSSRTPGAAPAASPAAPATAPATAPAEARLSLDRARVLIRSSPAGDVRINGQPRGRTPLVLRDLPFGSYVIAISRPGYVDAVQEVDMLPSQPVASIAVDLQRELEPGGATPAARPPVPAVTSPSGPATAAPVRPAGSLYVVSRPADARLFIDGQAYGTAPAVVPGLPAGRHQIRVEYPGYRAWERSVEVLPGQRVRVDATLVQEPR